jgi:hypothetical protein
MQLFHALMATGHYNAYVNIILIKLIVSIMRLAAHTGRAGAIESSGEYNIK